MEILSDDCEFVLTKFREYLLSFHPNVTSIAAAWKNSDGSFEISVRQSYFVKKILKFTKEEVKRIFKMKAFDSAIMASLDNQWKEGGDYAVRHR
jgi:hypothetical protein